MITIIDRIGEFTVPQDKWMMLVWAVQKNGVTTKHGSIRQGPSAGKRAATPSLIVGGTEQELREYAASNEIILAPTGGMKEQ